MANRMTSLLIVGYIGALALGAYELQRDPFVPIPPSEHAVESPPPLQIPVDDIESLAAYDAIVERPLFRRDRLPESETQVSNRTQPRPAQDDVTDMRLAAVLKGPDSLTALIEDQTGATKVLHQGEQIGRWRIDKILDDSVVVVSNGNKKTLLVHRFDNLSARRTLRRRPPGPTKRTSTRRPSRTTVERQATPPAAVHPDPDEPSSPESLKQPR